MKTELRDPADLRIHPLHKKNIPAPEKDSPEWLSFVDGVSAAGPDGIPPIVITESGEIMKGVRRWLAAKQLGWTEIRCDIQPVENCAALIVESLLGQRNMTRGAKVYLALGMLEEFVKSAEHRRLLHLKKGVKTLEKPLSSNSTKPESLRDLADKFGVGKDTIFQAIKVREIFGKQPAIKSEWEPKLLSGDKNLWNVLSAVGGAGTDQSGRETGIVTTQLELAFTRIAEHAAAWNKLPDDSRNDIVEKWREAAQQIPKPLRKTIIEILENA